MANMKLVGTQWDGACVIACDCGSEEPVTGTVTVAGVELDARDISRLEREVTRSKSIEDDTRKKIVQAERYIEQLER